MASYFSDFYSWDVLEQQRQKIVITDYGYEPNNRENVIPALAKALKECIDADSSILFSRKADMISGKISLRLKNSR